MIYKIVASLAPRNTDDCLKQLKELSLPARLAEVCLDTMQECDLPRILRASPYPLIITCRPTREGGRFAGSEVERRQLLLYAMKLQCAYVDLEWDSVDLLASRPTTSTKIIVSRHWYDAMPTSLLPIYKELQSVADVVKLVGMARCSDDVFPIFDLLQHAKSPVIGLAMGLYGVITRLLSPCFENCFLTYAVPDLSLVNAPGQLVIRDMLILHYLHAAEKQPVLSVVLCDGIEEMNSILKQNFLHGSNKLSIPWIKRDFDEKNTKARLKSYFKKIFVYDFSEYDRFHTGQQEEVLNHSWTK